MQERLEVVHFPLNTTNATSKSKSFMFHANKVPIFWGSVPTYVISGPKRTIQEAEIDPWLNFSFSSFCYFTLVDFSVSFVLLLFLLSLFPCFFLISPGILESRVQSSTSPPLLFIMPNCEQEGMTLSPFHKQKEQSRFPVWISMLQHVEMLRGWMNEKQRVSELTILIVFKMLALAHM